MIKYLAILSIFVVTLYFYMSVPKLEGFTGFSQCYNMLIKKNNAFYLYNQRKAYVPGVNPVKFDSLEDYTEFVKYERAMGRRCPVLFYEHRFNAQNKSTYKRMTDPLMANLHMYNNSKYSPIKQSKLFDASHRHSSKFNKNNYPGFDPENQYVGLSTPLDKMFHETQIVSDNPMDPNWGGKRFTRQAIRSGKYAENK
jgi:hypothetical protein